MAEQMNRTIEYICKMENFAQICRFISTSQFPCFAGLEKFEVGVISLSVVDIYVLVP
jgi:hypothetical protein